MGAAVRAAARHCRHLADRRFSNRLHELENALLERGWKARCLSRPIEKCDSVYWPAREVAILVEITDFETQWERYVDETPSLGKRYLKDDWPYTTVPIMNGQVLAPLALRPSSHMPLPDLDRGYYKIEDIEDCEAAGITPYVPKPDRSTARRSGHFPKSDFQYDDATDTYSPEPL